MLLYGSVCKRKMANGVLPGHLPQIETPDSRIICFSDTVNLQMQLQLGKQYPLFSSRERTRRV